MENTDQPYSLVKDAAGNLVVMRSQDVSRVK